MHALKIDTLKFAQRLRDEAKFPPEQAEKAASVFSDTMILGFSEWQEQQQLATKTDLAASETKLPAAIVAAENKLALAIEQTKAEIAAAKAETIRWMIGMVLALAGFMFGVLKIHS